MGLFHILPIRSIYTARQRSYGKVIFWVLSVCHSVSVHRRIPFDHCGSVQICSLGYPAPAHIGTCSNSFTWEIGQLAFDWEAFLLFHENICFRSTLYCFFYTFKVFISQVNTGLQLGLVTVSLAAPVFGFVDHVYLHYLWYVLMCGLFTPRSLIADANAN